MINTNAFGDKLRHLSKKNGFVSSCDPQTMLSVFTVCTGVLLFWTMSRGFRLPHPYGVGHWLINYNHGFIKRGMIGTLVQPLFHAKSPDEIRLIIETLSMASLIGLGAALIYASRIIFSREHGGNPAFVFPVIVFATSSFPTVAASMNGYFDHFLELITLAGILMVSRGRFYVVPFLGVFALCIHELFFIYGLPPLILAVLLKTAEMRRTKEISLKKSGFVLAYTIIPCALFYLTILIFQADTPKEQVNEIREDVYASGVFDRDTVDNVILFHLKNNLTENYRQQKKSSFVQRILNPEIGANVFPSLFFITAWILGILMLARRPFFSIPALAATLSPLVIHLVAWDTHRFSNFTIFHAFATLLAAVVILKPKINFSRRALITISLVFLSVILCNLLGTYKTAITRTEKDSIFHLR